MALRGETPPSGSRPSSRRSGPILARRWPWSIDQHFSSSQRGRGFPNQTNAFVRDVQDALPFPIRQMQTDHGNQLSLAFRLTVQVAGVEHRYVRPRRP